MPRLKITQRQTRPIAIALSLVATAMAASRYIPHPLPPLPHQIDLGVVVLFVPLCALMLALVFQVVAMTLRGAVPRENQPSARAIAHWRE